MVRLFDDVCISRWNKSYSVISDKKLQIYNFKVILNMSTKIFL